jgi:hypothetical protein
MSRQGKYIPAGALVFVLGVQMSTSRWRVVICTGSLTLLVILSGCDLIFPFDIVVRQDSGPNDALDQAHFDLLRVDHSGDLRLSDHPPTAEQPPISDGLPGEGAPTDQYVESGQPDGGSGGTHVWSMATGCSGMDRVRDLAVDSGGNVYIIGDFTGTLTLGSTPHISSGSSDIFVASFSPSGKLRWSKSFGSSNSDVGYGVAAGSTSVYITGSFRDTISFGGTSLTSVGVSDIFVGCLSSATGGHIWSKQFGGKDTDSGHRVALDGSGQIAVTGDAGGGINFGVGNLNNKGLTDLFVVTFDAGGKAQWSTSFGGNGLDHGNDVAVNGGVVWVTGSIWNTKTGRDVFAASLDSTSGSLSWSSQISGTGAGNDEGFGVAADSSGNGYVTGGFQYAMTIGSTLLTATGQTDILVASFTKIGAVRWAKGFGGTGVAICRGLDAVWDKGAVHVTGRSVGSVLFGTTPVTPAGNADIFLATLSGGSGVHQRSIAFGSSGFDNGYAVEADGNGHVFLGGDIQGPVNFGGGATTFGSSYDGFVVKLKP